MNTDKQKEQVEQVQTKLDKLIDELKASQTKLDKLIEALKAQCKLSSRQKIERTDLEPGGSDSIVRSTSTLRPMTSAEAPDSVAGHQSGEKTNC